MCNILIMWQGFVRSELWLHVKCNGEKVMEGFKILSVKFPAPSERMNVLLSGPILWKEVECGSDWWWCWLDLRLTKTSYCILMRWQPRKLVGGSGGTNSCSDFQSSVLPTLILPRLTAASSRLSVSITLFLVMYWIVWNNTNVMRLTDRTRHAMHTPDCINGVMGI